MGKEKLTFAVILALALALRLWGIDQSLWLDEASQAQMSVLTPSQIWSGRDGDFHPPLFYFLAHYWLQFNYAETWLRLLPVGIGLLGVWSVYFLAREVFPSQRIKISHFAFNTGHLASFLLAINPFHIFYSQEFRMYSLVATLGTWAMYLFLRRSRGLWLVLGLMLYTHYTTFLLLPTLLIYCLVFEKDRLKYVLLQLAATLLVYSPWYPQLLAQLSGGVNIDTYLPGWREVLTLGPISSVPVTLFKLLAGRINFMSRIFYGGYLGFVLVLFGSSLILARVKRWFLVSWVFLPLLLSIIISFVIPMTQPFRLIFILPALILILTQAVMRFPRLVLLFIVYISITGVVMYATRPRLQREQWRQASQYLQSMQIDQSAVVIKFSGNFAPLQWYAPDLEVIPAAPEFPARIEQISRRLASLNRLDTVYVLEYLGELTDPYRQVEKFLKEEGFDKKKTDNFEGVGFIDVYTRQ